MSYSFSLYFLLTIAVIHVLCDESSVKKQLFNDCDEIQSCEKCVNANDCVYIRCNDQLKGKCLNKTIANHMCNVSTIVINTTDHCSNASASTTAATTINSTISTTHSSVTSSPIAPTRDGTGTGRGFNAPSFIGGIVLAFGLMAVLIVAFKFYQAKTEMNYHTL
ncbi:sialomucin core protein 24-like protein [Dinothrombium tinctorium]|uniref:Sialomucin core protein 24-like protein n=1 Tax=Dinothrombium tinctorium TaxID=1965070 RepID=A0A443R6C7_9ACAR|nr:sialomucin core protein 24-like protein [Dinothrombium tinctorium]